MILSSEAEMLEFGKSLASTLPKPTLIELVGDVGTGKTTITRGIAKGLGITEPVTSPSFTISKQYAAPDGTILAHYDFYRLEDPGLMAEDFFEALNDPHTITVVEWADTIQDFLPKDHTKFTITIKDDEKREVTKS